MHTIDIFRGADKFVTVYPENNSTQIKAVMGENSINLEFKASYYIAFKLGDHCTVYGETYKLYKLPTVKKSTKYGYEYTLKLQGEGSDLEKVLYLFLGDNNALKEPSFSLMGNAKTFMDLMLLNLERVLPGRFTLGEIIDTPYKNLTFSTENCAAALSKIAQAFSVEWWVEGTKLHLANRRTDTGLLFEHGRGRGLYEIIRTNVDSASVITRLYPFGSDKNLPPAYGSTHLRLTTLSAYSVSGVTIAVEDLGNGNWKFTFNWTPSVTPQNAVGVFYRRYDSAEGWTGSTAGPLPPRSLTFPAGPRQFKFVSYPSGVETPVINVMGLAGVTTPQVTGFPEPYMENGVDVYDVIEYSQIFDDVYPHRTGTVTAVDAGNVYRFMDTGMDFDLNAQLLPGLAPKIVFNTGQLAGWQFEVSAYDHSTKTFTILKNKQETALDVPSDTLKPAIGDKYVIVDIIMPDTYIQAAEAELLRKGQELLLKNGSPQVSYAVTIDPKWMRDNKKSLKIGDEVWIKDDDLALNRKIRVVNVQRGIVDESQYSVQLSDTVQAGTLSQIINVQTQTAQAVSNVSGQLQSAAIMNGKVVGDLRFEQGTAVFDGTMPTIASPSGTHKAVYIDETTGKLVRVQ